MRIDVDREAADVASRHPDDEFLHSGRRKKRFLFQQSSSSKEESNFHEEDEEVSVYCSPQELLGQQQQQQRKEDLYNAYEDEMIVKQEPIYVSKVTQTEPIIIQVDLDVAFHR